MKIIGKSGYILYKDKLNASEKELLNDIRKELTVKPNVNPEFCEEVNEFKVYKETKEKMYIPICYGIQKFGLPEKNNFPKLNKRDNLKFAFPLRDNQKPAAIACLSYLNNPKRGRCLLAATCGFGKTALALYCICEIKLKTLIIVHKSFLLNQWKERIEQFVPNAKIGEIRGKVYDVEGKDIVIGMLQSLSMKKYEKEAFNDFGMVVVDEAHHISSEVFSRALPIVCSQYMMGLSATPERKDGLTKVFKWHLGDIAFSSSGVKDYDVIAKRVLINSFNQSYNKELLNFKGNVKLPLMINNITGYYKRNNLILDEIRNIMGEEGRQGLILSDRRNHLIYLKNEVDKMKLKIKDKETGELRPMTTGFYMGGAQSKKKDLELKESESKDVILGTISMAREGLDIPGLSYLILCSPVGDVEQIVGRILRKRHTVNPLVVDIVDNFSVFIGMGFKRMGYYKKNKFVIHNVIINDELDKPLDLSALKISCSDMIEKNKELSKEENFITINKKVKKDGKYNLTKIDDYQNKNNEEEIIKNLMDSDILDRTKKDMKNKIVKAKTKTKTKSKNIMNDGFAFLSSDSD